MLSPTKTRTRITAASSKHHVTAWHAPTAAIPQVGEKRKEPRASSYIEYKNVPPAAEVALYYGFTPLPSPLVITRKDRERARELCDDEPLEASSITPTLEERVALLRYYEEKRFIERESPAMVLSELTLDRGSRRKPGERLFSIEVMGSDKSIAEAILIQSAFATLQEIQHTNLLLHINSVGDQDSAGQFMRELGNHCRKHVAVLPSPCKTLFRTNPLSLLRCEHEKCRALAKDAPRSISFLGEGSRRHFREVLEFLEELEIPYEINHTLHGNRAFSTETLFEIREATSEGSSECLCSGMRYNTLARRLGSKHDVPSVGLNLALSHTPKETRSHSVRLKKPMLFFLQLGSYAKLKSLRVIELLRKAHIPIYQALGLDKLVSQLSVAENTRTPFSIIFGQREALENSVIIRNTLTRAQETVKIHDLVAHLQKMKIG